MTPPTRLSADDLARITRSSGWRAHRIEVFDTSVGRVIVKGQRPARHPARYRLMSGLARLLGTPMLAAAPALGGVQGQTIEIDRLQVLGAAGAPVPRVLHVAGDYFVMTWLGNTQLAEMIHRHHPAALSLWQKGAQLLSALHAKQQYLSQCVARNVVVDDRGGTPRVAGMIDFEDDPRQIMSLAEAQVRDWLLYLQSSLWNLPANNETVDWHVDHWVQAEHIEVSQLFARTCRKLALLRHLPRSRRWGRDTVAVQAAAAFAHRYAQRHAAH
ncbi:hypothetical protein [Ottowia sp.]|uniref:hypothetical protein n=1 Tax=Ottowia sp. TaxID=1898956 RepID=UPI003A8AF6D0